MDFRKKVGNKNERLAVKFLKKNGYGIITTNMKNQLGEIDIIAKENGSIVFVEVKSRRGLAFGSPKSSVTSAKQRRISMVALLWLKKNKMMDTRARFDVVSIVDTQPTVSIELIKNAFDLHY